MKVILIDSEFKNLIPPLSAEERANLEESILNEGCRDALVLWNDTLIDGHNRYEICTAHNLPYNTIQRDFKSRDEVILWIIKNQKARRNLTAFSRGMLESKAIEILQKQAKEKQLSTLKQNTEARLCEITQTEGKTEKHHIDVKKELAARIGTGEQAASRIININKRIEKAIAEEKPIAGQAPEELKSKLMSGETSINEAYNAIKKDERREPIQKQVQDIERGNIEKPTGLFDVIAMDPPWNYGTAYSAEGRRVANPYPEMSLDELKALELPAKDNCTLFLWTTQQFLFAAKELLDHYGFTYRAVIVWDKEKIGMGDFIRFQCEFCLIGIKGKPIYKDNHAIRDIIHEPRREHSRKPEAFYQLVNDLCAGDKLDYFCREKREGWASYGNDTKKF